MSASIYLDYAAATPLDERVFAAMQPYFMERFYNPSAAYEPARQVRYAVDDARHRLAMAIGAKRDEVVLTAGATESINLAFRGVLDDGDEVVIGATEHAAVRGAAGQYICRVAQSNAKGIITADAVRAAVTDKTKLVSVTAADSELGVVQSLAKIADVLDQIRKDRRARGVQQAIYFHTDASQTAGVIDLHVSRLGVDLLTLNAAKCYGPKQVGLLWVGSHVSLRPLIHGGGQERGLRAGTENVPGVIGFARALELAGRQRKSSTNHDIRGMRDYMRRELTDAFPDLIVNGSEKKQLPGHLNVSLDGLDAERVVFRLDMAGVMVATGAACAANKGTRSTVLSAIGLNDSVADGSLRISLGRDTTQADVEHATQCIIEAIRSESRL